MQPKHRQVTNRILEQFRRSFEDSGWRLRWVRGDGIARFARFTDSFREDDKERFTVYISRTGTVSLIRHDVYVHLARATPEEVIREVKSWDTSDK